MIYGFVRVSKNHQAMLCQRQAIDSYARNKSFFISDWLETSERIDSLTRNDVLIVAKLFRLGRDPAAVFSGLQRLLEKGVEIHSVEDGLIFTTGQETQKLAHIFGLAAGIVQDTRSRLSKEGLEVTLARGGKLGRPSGSMNKKSKLSGKSHEIRNLLSQGVSVAKLSRRYDCDVATVRRYIKRYVQTNAGDGI